MLRQFAVSLDEAKQIELAEIIIALMHGEQNTPATAPGPEDGILPDKTAYDSTANDETAKEEKLALEKAERERISGELQTSLQEMQTLKEQIAKLQTDFTALVSVLRERQQEDMTKAALQRVSSDETTVIKDETLETAIKTRSKGKGDEGVVQDMAQTIVGLFSGGN